MDEEAARMLGKLVGTNFSLVGSFQQSDMIEVSARLVSNETGKELSNTSKTSQDRNYLEAVITFEIAHSIGSSLPKPLAELAFSQSLDPNAADEALRRVYELQRREEEARKAFVEANRLESIKKRGTYGQAGSMSY